MIECSTFHNCEIDALYSESSGRELDDEAVAALTEHAKTCPECAERLGRLRGNRNLVLSVAVEPVPADFEARIMAAVDAALAKRTAPALVAAAPASIASASAAGGGANVLRFMARPSFAVAATFVLVLGGAAVMMTRGSASAPMASMKASDESPAAVAAASASPVARTAEENGQLALATAAAPPPAAAMAAPAATAPAITGGAALAAKAGARPTRSSADDRAFEAAKALATAGRCSEALPKLDALSANVPEADLYAARCIVRTRGCAAAEARFDKAAESNAGTEVGSRAQLEGAKCYQSAGDVVAARKRYEAAKEEGSLSAEASQALEALDKSGAAKPGTPSGGAHASPKAVAAPRMMQEPAPPAAR